MRTTDGGSVWTIIDTFYVCNGDVVADPNNNSVFWSGGDHAIGSDTVMAVSKTNDLGNTWIRYDLTDTLGKVEALAVDPSNSNVVYAGGYEGSNAALYKTIDGGSSWIDMSAGLGGLTVRTIAINPDNTSIIYAGTVDGIYKSTDAGTTWVSTGCSLVWKVIVDPSASNTVYTATSNGVFVSHNAGGDWHELNEGLDTTEVHCLDIDPENYIFCGTFVYGAYRLVPNFDPPEIPDITQVEKSDGDATLTWNAVTTDTAGNPEEMAHYVVYRSTSPSFVPETSDSIAAVVHPETSYIDIGALSGSQSYYYLVKAVDNAGNRSAQSNMGYVFHKSVNENASATDKNWVSLPWYSGYAQVSELTNDLSREGDPLVKVTNLRDDQQYESWLWDSDFIEWYGANFAIESGRGYELVTTSDTVVILVGANDPHGLVTLNENADKTDKNWVSIPYNAVYTSVSAITSEYSPGGVPLTKLTNLRDDQQFESWLWDSDFFEWYGANFAIVPGRSYEFVTTVDTTWDPTEYSGSKQVFLASRGSGIDVHLGAAASSDRTPLWHMADGVWHIANSILPMAGEPRAQGTGLGAQDKERHTPHAVSSVARQASSVEREASGVERGAVSHIVLVHIAAEQCGDIVFTAYRPDQPYDVLTEAMVGSGRALKDGRAALWFDVGNFATPWQPGEEVILIIESYINGTASVAITAFSLDALVDMQKLDNVTLQPIPEPTVSNKNAHWTGITNDNVVGYSLYDADTRLNTTIISDNVYETNHDAFLRPVIRGGFETVYSSQGKHNSRTSPTATTYALSISPNPFSNKTIISYGMSDERHKELPIHIYDISGRLVKSFGPLPCAPGTMQLSWDGTDAHGRTVPSGVYFVRLVTDEKTMQEKILLVR